MTFLGFFGTLQIRAANPETTVSLPALSRAMVGEDFAVNVTISNVVDLRIWEFKLFYETKFINALKVKEGPFLKGFADDDKTYFWVKEINDAYNGTYGLVWAYCALPLYSAAGSGTLATIDFKGTDAGTAHMTLEWPVKLSDSNMHLIDCSVTNGEVLVAWPEPLDINVDIGAIYFPGELVESFIMTTFHGIFVTPTSMNTTLYNPEGEAIQLAPEQVAQGFYKATYTMPSDASPGTYAIKVKATYVTDSVQALGTFFKTWQLSSTLNSKLVYLEGTVLWIKTNVGTIKVDLSTVITNTTPKAVDWNTIGLYISLALLASIAVVLAVLYFYLRARFRSGAVPS